MTQTDPQGLVGPPDPAAPERASAGRSAFHDLAGRGRSRASAVGWLLDPQPAGLIARLGTRLASPRLGCCPGWCSRCYPQRRAMPRRRPTRWSCSQPSRATSPWSGSWPGRVRGGCSRTRCPPRCSACLADGICREIHDDSNRSSRPGRPARSGCARARVGFSVQLAGSIYSQQRGGRPDDQRSVWSAWNGGSFAPTTARAPRRRPDRDT
jgi:hypothetical protein